MTAIQVLLTIAAYEFLRWLFREGIHLGAFSFRTYRRTSTSRELERIKEIMPVSNVDLGTAFDVSEATIRRWLKGTKPSPEKVYLVHEVYLKVLKENKKW